MAASETRLCILRHESKELDRGRTDITFPYLRSWMKVVVCEAVREPLLVIGRNNNLIALGFSLLLPL